MERQTTLNGLQVLTQIRALCEILKVDEADQQTYRLYKLVEGGESAAPLFDDVDAEVMWHLLHTPQSVRSIRMALWTLYSSLDNHSAVTAVMSQYSWEQLRTWIHTHD